MTDHSDAANPNTGDLDLSTVPPDVVPRLLRALDRSPATIVSFIDSELRTRWISESYTWLTGADPGSRMGRQSLERVHPDDVERLLDGLSKLQQIAPASPGGVPVLDPIRYRVLRPDGSWQTMETLVFNLLDDPQVKGLVLVGRQVEGALDGVGHVLDLLVSNVPLLDVLSACAGLMPAHMGTGAVVAPMEDGLVVGTVPGSPGEKLATDDRWWRGTLVDGQVRAPSDFRGFPDELAESARAVGFRTVWSFPLSDVATGEVMGALVMWTRYDGEPHIGTDSGIRQVQRLAGLAIGEHRHRHRLRREAMTDPLTGLGNRSALWRRLDAAGGEVTVAILDLDDFKPVNDTYGHDTGDKVLRVVAERLAHAVREADLVVRLGGDEFVVAFADDVSAEGAAASAERLLKSLDSPIALSGIPPIEVGASLGLATGTPEDVVRLADETLYETKRAKRSRRLRPERTA